MSSLRLALKQSLQESAANQNNDDSDAAFSSGNDSSSGDDERHKKESASASLHFAANTIQSKWKSSAKHHDGKRKKHLVGEATYEDGGGGGDGDGVSVGAFKSTKDYDFAAAAQKGMQSIDQQQHSSAAAASSNDQQQQQPFTKKKKKARNKSSHENEHDAAGSKTVPHPSIETIELQHGMTPRKARKYVIPGLRVKVRFATMRDNKKKRCYFGGRISAVSKEGSKIRIRYDDNTTEVTRFPDKDVIIDDTGNGEHSVRADKFIPRKKKDEVQGEAAVAESHAVLGDSKPVAKPFAKSPRPVANTTYVEGEVGDAARVNSPFVDAMFEQDDTDADGMVKRKRGRPPKHRSGDSSLHPSPKQQSASSITRSPTEAQYTGSEGDSLMSAAPRLALHGDVDHEHNAGKVLKEDGKDLPGATALRPSDQFLQGSVVDRYRDDARNASYSVTVGSAITVIKTDSNNKFGLERLVMKGDEEGRHFVDGKQLANDVMAAPQPATEHSTVLPDHNERAAKRLHIHIPAHKLHARDVSTGEEVEKNGDGRTEQVERVKDDTVVSAAPTIKSNIMIVEQQLDKSHYVDGSDAAVAGIKRNRTDAGFSDDADDESQVAKKASYESVKSSQLLPSQTRHHLLDFKATTPVSKSPSDVKSGDASLNMVHDHVPVPLAAADRSESFADAKEDSELIGNAVSQFEPLGTFDSSIVRSGRRAAQQANERITSRQPLVIDSPEGKKGRRKRRELEDGSETSEDDSQWVQCDLCSKWRIIPSIVVSTLPKQWYCSDNLWDSKRASCEAPEQTPKQVAKEKKKRKRLQQRIRMGVDAAAGIGGTALGVDGQQREETPVMEGFNDSVIRESPESTHDTTEDVGREKKTTIIAGKKVRSDNTEMSETLGVDAQGRRGRGRPRRIKELVKPAMETESFAQSTAGVADETDNLEWVQCESCQKWRKLPAHVSADDLPETWYCNMNTWNSASASCDAPEDKADGLQDINFHTGAGSGKLSYRNLIFGNTGRKPSRPISERARAAESLFIAPNDDEDAPPVVMYANSSAFVVRKKGNPALVADDNGSLSILQLMSHSNLWTELRVAPQSLLKHSSDDKPSNLMSYTFDTLPSNVKAGMKAILLQLIDEKSLTANDILVKMQSKNAESDDRIWSISLSYCDLNVIVTTLFELVKEGMVECVQDTCETSCWNPHYRLRTRKAEMITATAVLDDINNEKSKTLVAATSHRLLKFNKPWKQSSHTKV
ncbi:hypothetical protein MPSEU_000145900 [Mayamaea pseudoterrestris]|nr:hypothetical protein MPSEU_000145900 [Mayamaea pseudoterrestris]